MVIGIARAAIDVGVAFVSMGTTIGSAGTTFEFCATFEHLTVRGHLADSPVDANVDCHQFTTAEKHLCHICDIRCIGFFTPSIHCRRIRAMSAICLTFSTTQKPVLTKELVVIIGWRSLKYLRNL